MPELNTQVATLLGITIFCVMVRYPYTNPA